MAATITPKIYLPGTLTYSIISYKGLFPDLYCSLVEFTFEANTKKRYKVVRVANICPNDTSNFHKACQKIVEAAKLDKDI